MRIRQMARRVNPALWPRNSYGSSAGVRRPCLRREAEWWYNRTLRLRESESVNSGPALAGQNPGSVFTEEVVRVGRRVALRVQGEACLFPSPAGEMGVTLDSQLGAKENKE